MSATYHVSAAFLLALGGVSGLGFGCSYIVGFLVGHSVCLHSTERRLREGEVIVLPGGTIATKNGWTAP